MKANTQKAMRDAVRRYISFHKGEPIQNCWLGLGTESFYRDAITDGLMTWHDGKTPPRRCAGWLVLTKKGESVFMQMLADIANEKLGHYTR